MTQPPSISVLLPVRDAGETLDACLASLHGQKWTDWECLAIDDHSSDDSAAILAKWARRDPRIRPLSAPDPGGIVSALEEGRRQARALLVARQDADDLSDSSRLSRQIEAMRADDSLAVLGCMTRSDREPRPGMRRYLDWLSSCTDPAICAQEIWVESPIAHPTAMIRAAVLEEVGGYRERGWPEDYDLWLRIHRSGGGIRNLPEVLYEWSDSPERLSRNDHRYAPDAFLRCRLHHLRRWFAEQRIARPLAVWGAGRDGRRLARAWETELSQPGPAAASIAAFVDIDPRKIGGKRRDRPVLGFLDARRNLPDAFYLVAVGVEGARDMIRSDLASEGLSEGSDFLCLH